MEYKSVNILLVDDDQVDVMAIKSALEERNIANPVYVARDGVIALDLLRGANGVPAIPEPFLILLDLNMPRMNGLELLAEIRKDKRLRSSIIFILTTSRDERDRMSAYQHNVAGYVVKSDVGEDFMNLISLLQDYKLLVQFPVTIGSSN